MFYPDVSRLLLLLLGVPILLPTPLWWRVLLRKANVSTVTIVASAARPRLKSQQVLPPLQQGHGIDICTISKYTLGWSVPNVNITSLSQSMWWPRRMWWWWLWQLQLVLAFANWWIAPPTATRLRARWPEVEVQRPSSTIEEWWRFAVNAMVGRVQ